jgi:hypothetical protein
MAPLAYGQPESFFDWYGFLQLSGPDNTVGTGGVCRALFDVVQPDPCFPVDTATNEYTVVIDNLSIATVVNMGGGNYRTTWSGGQIRVFEDPLKNADWAAPGTFLEGTLVLIGGPYASFVRIRYATGIGSFGGDFNWTGGTRFDNLPNCQENGWKTFGGLSNRVTLPPGYIEAWDGQFYCNSPIPVNQGTWGSIKSLYR